MFMKFALNILAVRTRNVKVAIPECAEHSSALVNANFLNVLMHTDRKRTAIWRKLMN